MKEFELNGMYFVEGTDRAFAQFITEAQKSRRRIWIIYKPGWEDFSGYHSRDGLHHTLYVGKSTGTKPIPLSLASTRSTGGGSLLTVSKAIEAYGYK